MPLRLCAARRLFVPLYSKGQAPSRFTRLCLRSLRFKSTAASPVAKAAGKKTLYPERLLVYHAGTGRTVLLGCLKVTTIFIFSFFTLVVAPTHFNAEDQPKWVAFAGNLAPEHLESRDSELTIIVALSGTIPMLFIAYMSAPFVTYIHLRIPAFARNSKDMLIRYAKTLPKDAELDVTMMNFLGKPKATRLKLQDLYPVKERFGLVNYARDTDVVNAKRPWWMGKVARQFGVHGKKSGFLKGEIWEMVKTSIEKNSMSR